MNSLHYIKTVFDGDARKTLAALLLSRVPTMLLTLNYRTFPELSTTLKIFSRLFL